MIRSALHAICSFVKNRMKLQSISIHQHMRLSISIGFILCALVGVACIRYLVGTYDQEMAKMHQSIGESYYQLLSKHLSDVSDISLQIISNSQIQQSLRVVDNGLSEQEKSTARYVMQVSLASLSVDIPSFVSAIAVIDNQGTIQSYGGLNMSDQMRADLADMTRRTPQNASIRWEAMAYGDRRYMVLLRAIRESKKLSLELLGYEAIFVDAQMLMRKVAPNDQDQSANTMLMLDGEAVYIGEYLHKQGLDKQAVPQKGWQIIHANHEDYFAHAAAFMNGQIRFVTYTLHSSVTKALEITQRSLFVLLAPLLIIFLFEIRMTDGIFRRLTLLTRKVRDAHHQNAIDISFENIQNGSEDEVDSLIRHMQKLMNHIGNLVGRELKRQLFSTQAQYKMLQAQIHPHFLYNTLDTIHALSVKAASPDLSRMTMSLAKLVRASYLDGMYGTVEEELDFVTEYLSIYKIRYGARMQVHIHCGQDIETVLMPKMTIQPLIENAIRYGLMRKTGRGVISLSIRRGQGRLKISVTDNGIGISQDIIARYSDEAFTEELEMHGLANVICRLRYAYQKNAVIQIKSREGCWTNIAISIPDQLPKEASPNANAYPGGR